MFLTDCNTIMVMSVQHAWVVLVLVFQTGCGVAIETVHEGSFWEKFAEVELSL